MKRKLISMLLILSLCLCLAVSVSASYDMSVWDEADLLTDWEEASLSEKLQELSRQYEAEIVIMTLESAGGRYIDELVESVYDTMGFGYGSDHDGVLLLICMDIREFRILSNGFAADAITLDYIDAITDDITPDLSNGDYADAFDTFVDKCAYYLDGHINGFPFNAGKNLLIALIVGLVTAFIVTGIFKGQLKSVRKQDRAGVYVRPGSLNITNSGDFYMYRTVTRTAKPKSNSSSSGGSSRNVGGGSF